MMTGWLVVQACNPKYSGETLAGGLYIQEKPGLQTEFIWISEKKYLKIGWKYVSKVEHFLARR